MTNSPGLVSESCHESTFKLIRHHNFNDVLFSIGATWTFSILLLNGVHLSHSRQVAHVYYQLFDSKMADGGQCRSSNMIYYAEMHRQTFEKQQTYKAKHYINKSHAYKLATKTSKIKIKMTALTK
jgi:hypothetical protein